MHGNRPYFVGENLLQTSVEVKGLEFLGSYGSSVLALVAVATYVPLNSWIGNATGIQALRGGRYQAVAEPVRGGGGSALVVTPAR